VRPDSRATIAPSECFTGKITWARMGIGTDAHEVPEGKHQALTGRD
jgi:hypothetical protein